MHSRAHTLLRPPKSPAPPAYKIVYKNNSFFGLSRSHFTDQKPKKCLQVNTTIKEDSRATLPTANRVNNNPLTRVVKRLNPHIQRKTHLMVNNPPTANNPS